MKAREFLKEDDYWGDSQPNRERREREEADESRQRTEEFVAQWVDDNIGTPPGSGGFHRDEIQVYIRRPKGQPQTPKANRDSMREEMRELAYSLLDDMRQLDLRTEYEISALGEYNFHLAPIEEGAERSSGVDVSAFENMEIGSTLKISETHRKPANHVTVEFTNKGWRVEYYDARIGDGHMDKFTNAEYMLRTIHDFMGGDIAIEEGMTEDAADEEEYRMSMGWDQDDPDEMIGGGPEQYVDDNGEVWDSKDAYDDFMFVQKNAK